MGGSVALLIGNCIKSPSGLSMGRPTHFVCRTRPESCHQGSPALDTGFFEDVGDVFLDGSRADPENDGDLGICFATEDVG